MNKRLLIGLAVGISIVAVGYYAVRKITSNINFVDIGLKKVATELNKTCPKIIDEETQLDSVKFLDGRKFRYFYTLINYEIEEIDVDTLRKYLEPDIINNARTHPDLEFFRNNDVTMDFIYNDKSGVPVWNLSVTPDLYKDTTSNATGSTNPTEEKSIPFQIGQVFGVLILFGLFILIIMGIIKVIKKLNT